MRPYVLSIVLFGLFLILLATIQFATPHLVSIDSYFHIRFAEVMRDEGIRPAFPWLPLTILNEAAYADHHLLYHILLIPFTLGDLRVGAKWASIVFPALAFTAGYGLLRSLYVPFAMFWSLGFLAMSAPFLYRMNMTRVQGASLLLLIAILHVTLTKRYRWLAPLTFLYVWLYDGFVFAIVVVCIYVVLRGLLDHQFDWQPLLYTGLGVVVGNLLNPYFPNNLHFMLDHILTKVTGTTAINVGTEWNPYSTWSLVEHSPLALLAFVAGCFALGLYQGRMSTASATLLLLAVFFGLFLFKSRRFIEYYPAFALLFCAVAWQPLFEQALQQGGRIARSLPLLLLLFFGPAAGWNIVQARATVQSSPHYERFAAASAWLRTNSQTGSRVFPTDWDLFPQLFYYNTHNTYVVGLDPTYLQNYRADLYDTWRAITRGQIALPGLLIATMFESHYVISDLDHANFLERAAADPHLHEVFRDQEAVIFQVIR